MKAATRISESELRCPCCQQMGRLVYWRGEKAFGGRPLPVEWLQCDFCDRRTAAVIVRADGPYRAELIRLGKALGDNGHGIKRGGA